MLIDYLKVGVIITEKESNFNNSAIRENVWPLCFPKQAKLVTRVQLNENYFIFIRVVKGEKFNGVQAVLYYRSSTKNQYEVVKVWPLCSTIYNEWIVDVNSITISFQIRNEIRFWPSAGMNIHSQQA